MSSASTFAEPLSRAEAARETFGEPSSRADAAPGAVRAFLGYLTADRIAAGVAGLALVLGSALFLGGGRLHPPINSALGAGSEEFFRGFADKVMHTHGWEGMHLLILIGPLFWAVAAPALLDALHPAARALTSAARAALLLSASLWAVAFALDGFAAPVYAVGIAEAGTEVASGLVTAFRANAVVMSRLGLVSWVAGGLGMVGLAGALLGARGRTPWRIVVGIAGIAIGAWPLLAALEGEYAAGPFVSRFWMANALAVGLWYVALASCALGRARAREA